MNIHDKSTIALETIENDMNKAKKEFIISSKDDLLHLEIEPIPAQNLQVARPDYKSKEEEILERQLISSEMKGEGEEAVRTNYYEDQKRYIITDWNGNIRYTEPEMIRSWSEDVCSEVEIETKTEAITSILEVFKWKRCGRRVYVLSNCPKMSVHDYFIKKIVHKCYERKRINDPDGNITYTDWVDIGQDDVEQIIY